MLSLLSKNLQIKIWTQTMPYITIPYESQCNHSKAISIGCRPLIQRKITSDKVTKTSFRQTCCVHIPEQKISFIPKVVRH